MSEASQSQDVSSPGVSMEATLPLSWTSAVEISGTKKELRTQTNIALLRALAAIDVAAPEHETHNDQTQKAMERVEAKVDVVLLMVAQLMGANMDLPAEKPVTLLNQSIVWLENAAAPAAGSSVVVDLYLNPRLPQALHLPVMVKEVQTQDNGAKVVAELLDVTEDFDEWLTRTLFRYHRRALQASRQA
jgi:hypothetical protein